VWHGGLGETDVLDVVDFAALVSIDEIRRGVCAPIGGWRRWRTWRKSALRRGAAAPPCATSIDSDAIIGSAISSSATPIASNVIVLSADPFGSQSPPLGNLGRVLFSPTTQAAN
jgi:hypothetical protein